MKGVGAVAHRPTPEGSWPPRLSSILPNWVAWKERGGLSLSFRMTQALAGLGVVGEYLQKIRIEVTNTSHHCGEGEDTALIRVGNFVWRGTPHVVFYG